MSVLIKGMDMPSACDICEFVDEETWGCTKGATGKADGFETIFSNRRIDCPLVEIPPHGRLIDADKLILDFNDWWYSQFLHEQNDISLTIQEAMKGIEEAPTIIEAEE